MKERSKCTCKHIVKSRGVVHSELNPRCPLHGGVDHITLTFQIGESGKVHALDCVMDEDCNCG
jgi:hypothetical protein